MNGKYIYFAIASLIGVLCSLKSFLLFFTLAIIYFFLLFKFKRFSTLQLFFIISVFLLFVFSSKIQVTHNKTKILDTNTIFYIDFHDNPKIDGDLLQVIVREIRFKEKILLRYKLKSPQEKVALERKLFYGNLCIVEGALKQPLEAKNENAFNFREYLWNKHIFWEVEITKSPLSFCQPQKVTVLAWIKKIRFQGIMYLKNHFPTEVAALSSALIFGDRDLMDPDVLANYQKVGIIHLIAISGLHVSLLIGMVYFCGIRIGATKEFMINFLLIILPIYAVMTGSSPSVVRSVIMIFLILLSMKWKTAIKISPIDAISLAFSLFLFFTPMIIFDVGFQLSFSVSVAIILSASSILRQFQNRFFRMLIPSIIAQLSALPFLLFHFFGISLVSLAANLVYIPLFSFVFLPGLYILFFLQLLFGAIPSGILHTSNDIIHFSNIMTDRLADLPIGSFTPGRPKLILLILYGVAILAIFIFWEKRELKNKGYYITFLCCFILSFQTGWNHINPIGMVNMIDVGQGDSILIHLPFNKGNYLIDTGGSIEFNEEEWRQRKDPFEVGKDVVVPYLKSKGITKIDKLILTHGDLDHIGGAISVLGELNVKQILMPSVKEPSDTEMAIVQVAKKKNIPIKKVSEGDQWKTKDSLFYILSPVENFVGERNHGSVTIYAKIGGVSWFFGGDLDKEGEEEIVKKYSNLTFEVLKVGHHGSKTSSSQKFLKHYNPKVALISVGVKNRYGHPNQEVLDGLKEIHSRIYRTDLSGAITYRFYHGSGTFSTFLP